MSLPTRRTIPRYPELAAELARTGLTKASLSHVIDVHASYLSQVIHGHAAPSDDLKCRIAAALERPAEELFAVETAA